MKKRLILATCVAAFTCACASGTAKTNTTNQQKMDDQNYQDRRKQMQNQKPQGCCEAEKTEAPKQTAVATPEIKVEKTQ